MDSQLSDENNEKVIDNQRLSIYAALIPVVALVGMLA